VYDVDEKAKNGADAQRLHRGLLEQIKLEKRLAAIVRPAHEPSELTFSDWLGLVGVALTVIGFGITIFQVVRTRRAVTGAVGAIRGASILAALTALLAIEPELEDAVTHNDTAAARQALVKWRLASSEVRGVAQGDVEVSRALSDSLQDTLVIAIAAHRELDNGVGLTDATSELRGELRNVSAEISRVIGTLKMRGAQ
jgi:hypothetical protein